MKLVLGDLVGPYQLCEECGVGGMATVYQAWHTGLHRFEALKIPREKHADSAYVVRLLTEARLAAGLRHPNIVAIHGVSDPGSEVPYFAMEWIEGEDLATHLVKNGRRSLAQTIEILDPVAAALDFAHKRGVVHRDIKPANILLQFATADGAMTPKVVDFGISRAAEEEDGATRLTRNGMLVGTPEYMSPEQSGSGEVVEYPTDIYSLAVVAYEMLTGGPPFTAGSGVSRLAILIQHVRDTPAMGNSQGAFFSPEVEQVLLRGLAKKAADRYPDCTSFLQALREASWQEVGTSTLEIAAPGLAGGLISGLAMPEPAMAVADVQTLAYMPAPPLAAEPLAPASQEAGHLQAPPPPTKAQPGAAVLAEANREQAPYRAPNTHISEKRPATIPSSFGAPTATMARPAVPAIAQEPDMGAAPVESAPVPATVQAPAGRKWPALLGVALGGIVVGALLVQFLLGIPGRDQKPTPPTLAEQPSPALASTVVAAARPASQPVATPAPTRRPTPRPVARATAKPAPRPRPRVVPPPAPRPVARTTRRSPAPQERPRARVRSVAAPVLRRRVATRPAPAVRRPATRPRPRPIAKPRVVRKRVVTVKSTRRPQSSQWGASVPLPP